MASRRTSDFPGAGRQGRRPARPAAAPRAPPRSRAPGIRRRVGRGRRAGGEPAVTAPGSARARGRGSAEREARETRTARGERARAGAGGAGQGAGRAPRPSVDSDGPRRARCERLYILVCLRNSQAMIYRSIDRQTRTGRSEPGVKGCIFWFVCGTHKQCSIDLSIGRLGRAEASPV